MDEQDPLVAQCQSRLGQQLSGKWRLDALIGVGGMAAVYAATHRNGATAAIKILHPELANHAEVRDRFLREAYIANKVGHAGTVQVLDDDLGEQGEPYIVMELLRGESVEAHAERAGGRLGIDATLNIVNQLLSVLEAAHAQGIVHRDLKPENLFFTSQGQVKVLDFGIARLRESADTKKTRTGLLMGTPAFMAPEQALGRWSEVDGRTDLWAVGAIMFTLLTGLPVHEAETANEMIVMAATKPARSLARLLNAPLPLVRLVDRALEYEQSKRFADAAAMRAELVAAAEEMGVGQAALATPGASAGAAFATQATAIGGIGQASTSATAMRGEPSAATQAPLTARAADEKDAQADTYDAAFVSDEDVAAMTELFSTLEKTLVSQAQYGATHPESARRRSALFKHCASALMHTDLALLWNITPYSFTAKDKTLWEPRAPLDRIPYQLFSDGIRLLGILPGISEEEFLRLVALVSLDRTREVAPEDDFVTLLWDAGFDHVVYQAIDSFAEGDQQARAAFEKAVDQVVSLANYDSCSQLEEAWQKKPGTGTQPPAMAMQARVTRLLNAPEGADLEAVAQAETFRGPQTADSAADPQRALSIDAATQRMLEARLNVDTVAAGERFVVTAAVAFLEAHARGAPRAVAAPIRGALDGLAAAAPEMAIEFVRALAAAIVDLRGPEKGEPLCATFTGAVISKKTFELMLAGAAETGANQTVFREGLGLILRYLDETHVPIAIGAISRMTDEALRDLLVAYLQRVGRGHEEQMGSMFIEADVELGLALVRVLSAIGTPEARNAISLAARSPHPVVRIEALGHVEGASSERLRLELRALLEDREPGVRVAALRAMEQHSIRVAGPFLVMRIRSPAFDKLPFEERRQAFQTLCTLAPSRAEAVCLEVLQESRMMAGESHEQSRELAAEFLGAIGKSQQAYDALEQAAAKRWLTSDRVRSAAAKAREAMEKRIGGAGGAK